MTFQAALELLPAAERQTIEAAWIDGLTNDQIAVKLDVGIERVQTLLRRGQRLMDARQRRMV
jgi:DNA-directed RNA polymerase specialized sigma24 family protein